MKQKPGINMCDTITNIIKHHRDNRRTTKTSTEHDDINFRCDADVQNAVIVYDDEFHDAVDNNISGTVVYNHDTVNDGVNSEVGDN